MLSSKFGEFVRVETPQGIAASPRDACPACSGESTEIARPSYDSTGNPARTMEGMAVVLRRRGGGSCWPDESHRNIAPASGSVGA